MSVYPFCGFGSLGYAKKWAIHIMKHDNLIALLEEYFRGTLDTEQAADLEKWILEDKENYALAKKVCRIELLASRYGAETTIDTRAAWKKVRRRLAHKKNARFTETIRRISLIILAPLLLLSAYFIPRYFDLLEMGNESITIESAVGMTTCTTLPDGTKVWLNSGSTLSYPQTFKGDTRQVKLDGEAYFNVSKVEGQRFVVSAGDIQVEALGTEFNVEAYTDRSDDIRTTLSRGLVRISYPDSNGNTREVDVFPCDSYTYTKGKDNLAYAKVKPYTLSSWRDGKIVLDKTPLDDALRMVGNRYGIRFIVDNAELLQNRYTGTFSEQSLDIVLEMFSETTHISFSREETTEGEMPIIRVR